MSTSATRQILGFEETIAWLADLDIAAEPSVLERARLLLLDTVACAVAGFAEPEPQEIARAMAVSEMTVRWPGAPGLNMMSAAFAGSVAACWHEACEGLARAHGRPGLHAVPVAVSLGLARRATFAEVLKAIIAGYEIGGRAGEAMRIRSGLHVDGTWGLLASVASAASLLRLDRDRTLHALASAACQIPTSLYAPVAAGQTARNTYVGHAAAAAIGLAAAAHGGVGAPTGAFELAAAHLRGSDAPQPWTWAPPGEFLILQGYLKPYAAVRHIHYAASCAIERWRVAGGDTSAITGLRLETYQEALTYCGNRAPTTPIQAQFSLSHGTAFALKHGSLGPDAYTPQVFAESEHQRLEKLITVVADPEMRDRGARLSVRTAAGQSIYAVSSVVGDADKPMSLSDVTTKAFGYMKPSLGSYVAQDVISSIMTTSLSAPFAFTAN